MDYSNLYLKSWFFKNYEQGDNLSCSLSDNFENLRFAIFLIDIFVNGCLPPLKQF